MSPRTLPDDIKLIDIRDHIGHTLRRLRAHALTLALAPTFEALLSGWTVVQQKELELDDKIDEALVVVHAADRELNVFAQQVSAAVLALTNNDRTDSLYLHFFKGDPLHQFTRPILGDQLASMQAWPSSLSQSEHPSLQALGVELPALLAKAGAAEAARLTSEQDKRQFRDVGDRKKFVDAVNIARKETHGALATLPHKHPGLPSRFADSFFRRDRARGVDEPEVETVRATIDALKEELNAQEKLLARLEEEQAAADAAAEEQARREAEAQCAQIQKEIEQKQSELSALQAAHQAVR
jgi:DNA repair exonuclease SbcCD ATPase subunit